MNKQEELTALLSSFHDFDIVEARLSESKLTLGIVIPWGSMWKKDDYSYRIRIELLGCKAFECHYWEIKSDKWISIGENRVMRDTVEKITKNPDDIIPLELSIQSTTYNSPDQYVLHCIGGSDIDFATLKITANDYQIYNQNGDLVSIETFKQWHKQWWHGIQKMWDDQKRENR